MCNNVTHCVTNDQGLTALHNPVTESDTHVSKTVTALSPGPAELTQGSVFANQLCERT